MVDIELQEDPEICIKFTHDKKNPNIKHVKGINIDETAKYVLRNLNLATIAETDEMLIYSDGIYVPRGEKRIKMLLETMFMMYPRADGNPLLSIHKTKEIIEKIRNLSRISMEDFDNDINIINMENGLYHLDEEKLYSHDPNYLSKIQIPIKYDAKARCPSIDEIARRVLKTNDITKFFELTGYLLYRKHDIQKAFIFYGPGSSGKSIMLSIARTFVGADNRSNVTFKQIAEDTWAIAEFQGKLLNEAGDLDSTTIKETGTFKTLTGGMAEDSIRAQKKFGQPFSFVNYAKIIFATNTLPIILDLTTGLTRRLEIFICDRSFTPNSADEKLLNDITTPEEMSGLFNKVIPLLKELIKRKKYTNQTSAEDIGRIYAAASNPTKTFLDTCVVESPEGYILKSELYDRYVQFCEQNNAKPLHFNYFGRKINDIFGFSIKSGQVLVNKIKVSTWYGIRLRTGYQ